MDKAQVASLAAYDQMLAEMLDEMKKIYMVDPIGCNKQLGEAYLKMDLLRKFDMLVLGFANIGFMLVMEKKMS